MTAAAEDGGGEPPSLEVIPAPLFRLAPSASCLEAPLPPAFLSPTTMTPSNPYSCPATSHHVDMLETPGKPVVIDSFKLP